LGLVSALAGTCDAGAVSVTERSPRPRAATVGEKFTLSEDRARALGASWRQTVFLALDGLRHDQVDGEHRGDPDDADRARQPDHEPVSTLRGVEVDRNGARPP